MWRFGTVMFCQTVQTWFSCNFSVYALKSRVKEKTGAHGTTAGREDCNNILFASKQQGFMGNVFFF